MFVLVEGLNCSGKSTFISEQILHLQNATKLTTAWANPRRWDDNLDDNLDTNSILFGIYYSMVCTGLVLNFSAPVYLDRSWISAYVYDSIDLNTFHKLAEKWSKCTESIYFINTPIPICRMRLKFKMDYGLKTYVDKNLDWNAKLGKFHSALMELKETYGYKIKFVSGEEDGK